MAEDQNEAGVDSSNKPAPTENIPPKQTVTSEDEAEKKEFEEMDKAMDEIAKFVDQFNEKDEQKTKVEPKVVDSKESPVEDDPESNQSIRLILEDSEESKDLKIDEKEQDEEKDEEKPACDEKEETTAIVSKKDDEKSETNVDDKLDESKADENSSTDLDKPDDSEKENTVESPRQEEKKVEKENPPLEKIIIKINKKSNDDKIVLESSFKLSEPIAEKTVESNSEKEIPLTKITVIEKEPTKSQKEILTEPEVGIVGPPAAASEVLSEAELVTEKSSLPTDETKPAAVVSDRVVQWVENTMAKVDDPVPDQIGEEDRDKNEKIDISDDKKTRGRKRKQENDGTTAIEGSPVPRKAQKVVSNIIRRSIRCLNKMHAMDATSGGGNGKKATGDSHTTDPKLEDEEDSRKSPKVPQSQQNGAALPEETASSDRNISLRIPSTTPLKKEKDQNSDNTDTSTQDPQMILTKSPKMQMNQVLNRQNRGTGQRGRPSLQSQLIQQQKQQQQCEEQQQQTVGRETRKRRSAELLGPNLSRMSSNGNPCAPKKLCSDQREQYINSLIGSDKFTAEQLANKAEQLRAEVQDLDELARAKEMEWNEILSMRKLKEEAYLRIERRRQILGYMESNGPLSTSDNHLLPPASLALAQLNYEGREKALLVPKEEQGILSRDGSPASRRERSSKTPTSFHQQITTKQQHLLVENGPRQIIDAMSAEHRPIGEGRQGPIVDVRSIIADYRLRHPETVPRRRGRRMRNSINVGLGAGGAMVETIGHMDSRPSSADSCKSSSNLNDPNNAMSFKDVLVQFAKLSQQQGEPIKTPQNYPDVTLHPVAPTQTTQNSAPQTGSLLHGILTKSQSPRPTNFSPTLARLLTAPERERNAPTITANPHQNTQHLLQAYQGANSVSISDFLTSSKARTEITITPVVNSQQSHSSNLIHIDDQDDDTSIIEDRDSRIAIGSRDNREDKDPPRCQGCQERSAQFVCAGCGNQWYCSRECQVAAWDDHSDHCSG